MKPILLPALLVLLPAVVAAQPALTIYNANFAVVRDHVPLDLKAGVNTVSFSGVTAQMETDSVVLRDPAGKVPFQILDQNYRADTINQGMLLQLNEGKTITFLVRDQNQKEFPVQGRIIRSGYTPGTPRGQGGDQTPIIEVNGQLRFSLPGEPVFPALSDDAILKPTLGWQIQSESAVKVDADLSYVTSGFTWQAAYNLVAPEKGDKADLVGWVTITNQSGMSFANATVKLMAGDVNKIQPQVARAAGGRGGGGAMALAAQPVVTEKAFDEYHLYSLVRPATLRDRETEQVEFVRAEGITAPALYIYDGASGIGDYHGLNPDTARNPNYGAQSNKKVWVMREIKNTKENNLGLPLPKGRVRFYRQDEDQRLEFIGENNLDHTPKDETIRLYVGDSFDLVGERKRVDFTASARNDFADETFEIKVRNHKADAVEIRVVEHLYRGTNWAITEKTDPYTKNDAQTIEFRVSLKPDEEKTVTYKVHYTWE